MSPASGDFTLTNVPVTDESTFVSIQLMSPASGDEQAKITVESGKIVSIQLMSPASGDI